MATNSINQGAAGGIIIQPTWGTIEGGGSSGKEDNFDAILNELRTYLDAKADKKDVYMKDETDELLDGKSDTGHTHPYLPLSGGTLTGSLSTNGSDILLKTSDENSDDSGDIVWYYGNGQEKMRIWTENTYSSKLGPSFRLYKKDGTSLFNGSLSLSDHTHSYLPLSGGTLTGRLTGSGRISVPTSGGSWISQKNTDNASIKITTVAVTNGSRYDSIIGGMSSDDSSWNMGIIDNKIYFGRYESTQTENSFTKSVYIDLVNGYASRAYNANKLDNFETNNNSGKNANDVTYNGITYYTSNGPSTSIGATVNDGALYCQAYSTRWVAQIAQDYRNGNLFTRGKNNDTWQSWKAVSYNGHTHDDRYYTESEVDTKLNGKSNTNHTHSYLPLSGGTMTGQLLTSFKSAVAMGSRQADATTIPNLVNEVRYSSGGAGSINLTTAYTNNNITIPTGWYNYIYSPHRSGGSSGAASGDNHNYGTLLLYGMTMNAGPFAIRIASGSIAALFCISRHYYGTGGMTDGTTALPAGTVYYQY